jgi:hypothetical protein
LHISGHKIFFTHPEVTRALMVIRKTGAGIGPFGVGVRPCALKVVFVFGNHVPGDVGFRAPGLHNRGLTFGRPKDPSPDQYDGQNRKPF